MWLCGHLGEAADSGRGYPSLPKASLAISSVASLRVAQADSYKGAARAPAPLPCHCERRRGLGRGPAHTGALHFGDSIISCARAQCGHPDNNGVLPL